MNAYELAEYILENYRLLGDYLSQNEGFLQEDYIGGLMSIMDKIKKDKKAAESIDRIFGIQCFNTGNLKLSDWGKEVVEAINRIKSKS